MSHLATEDPIVPIEAAPLIGPTSATSSRRGSDAGSALELGSLHCSTSSTSTTPGPQNQRTNTPQPAAPTSTVAPSASKSTSPPSSATQSRKTWPRLIHAFRWWWWWEVGAALLSTTCILLIFATLMTMHEQPLSDWKLAISINATVSILTTVAKSALMLLVAESISHLKWLHYQSTQCLKDVQAFDEASRGPWGATMFVLGARGRSLLATIASVIVVVSLGFEPAAQQMLSFPSRSVALKSSAGAYVYQALALNTTDLVEIHPSTAAGYDPPNSLQVALINSFAGIVSDAPHDCQTSLCQFGDIETLGVCEQCRDATHQVHHIRNYTGSGGGEDADGEPGYKDYHDYFIANDPYYPVVQINYTNHGAIDGNNGFAISGNYAWSMDDLSNRRAGFMAINMSDLNSDAVESTTICDFSWCVRKYFAAEITHGQFHFEKESRFFLNITNSTGSGVYNIDTTFILGSPQPGFGRQYTVDQMVDYVLWGYLTKALSGDSSSNTLVQMMSRQTFNSTAGFMSLAITNWMRSIDNDGSVLYQGEALEPVTFVHVKWPWLVWPAMLTIVGSILLLICILRDRGRTTLFKSSALALLFHGLHGFDENDLKILRTRRVEDNETLEEIARRLRVKFVPDEDGILKFVKQ